MTPRVLHISADFPDPIEPGKTPVIRSFIDLTVNDFDHKVLSLNRINPTAVNAIRLLCRLGEPASSIAKSQSFQYGVALEYAAMGRGILHQTMLEKLGQLIAHSITSEKEPVDLLVAHKLTVEGIVAAKVSELTGIPYALTIQGNTDRKIIRARPDLGDLFRTIYQQAESAITFSPNARAAIEKRLGQRKRRIQLIPCPTELDDAVRPKLTNGDILSVFHLKNRKVKNLGGLARAAQLVPGLKGQRSIAIIGGGTHKDLADCERICRNSPSIRFDGPVERKDMQLRMNNAVALIVPSRSESFGLVFIEALFAGLPIIYPKGTSVDGYFDELPFAQGVEASSKEEIAGAIQRAITEEASMKTSLKQWQQSSEAQKFTRKNIAQSFTDHLRDALK